ncbi:hypothetical protein F5Y08DRAFT_342516 [Xylaria arbuscula]|nr:hypothetical protein F5Y08DRAFT_342516 [Xylaria arbuscula]
MTSTDAAKDSTITPESLLPLPPSTSIFDVLTRYIHGMSSTSELWKGIFDCQLMEECKRRRLVYHVFPPPDPLVDLIETQERSTERILHRWTIPMVNVALGEVANPLNPVSWTAQDLAELPEPSEASASTNEEYTSESLAKGLIVDKNGDWCPGMKTHMSSAPLRQLYTYCVDAKSRYGCIVTSKEVVVVRIKGNWSDQNSENDGPSATLTKDSVAPVQMQSIMEWKSIKWSEHKKAEAPGAYKNLTMNLALWIMHILAGNDNEIRSSYAPLKDENSRISFPLHLQAQHQPYRQ